MNIQHLYDGLILISSVTSWTCMSSYVCRKVFSVAIQSAAMLLLLLVSNQHAAFFFNYFTLYLTVISFQHKQDGRIDYGEFATMMRKGNAGLGSRTMRGNINISLADALGAKENLD